MASQDNTPSKLSVIFDRVLSILMLLGAVILALLMLAVCWDVIARTAIGAPLIWLLEFTEYGLLYITFLGTAWVLKHEAHVTSDLLLVTLHPRKQALMNMITSIIGACVCLILAWFGAAVSWEKLLSGSYQPTAIQTPDFPIFVIIPIGFLLLFIQFLRRAHGNLLKWQGAGKK